MIRREHTWDVWGQVKIPNVMIFDVSIAEELIQKP
jgi:hypothetical protein